MKICNFLTSLRSYSSAGKNSPCSDKSGICASSVLTAVLERIKSPLAITDEKGSIRLFSSFFPDLFSFEGSVLEGVSVCDFFLRSDAERFFLEIDTLSRNQDRSATLSLTGVCQDGKHLALTVSISLVCAAPKLFLLMFEDKSDVQREQVKIEKLEHQAAIGTFTSGVAHEFNNVLAGIRGYAQLAKHDLHDIPLVSKAFQIIEQESIRGADLCKNLSLYSGNKKLSLEPVIIQDLLSSTIELQKRYLFEDRVTVDFSSEEMPPFFADRFKLQQVILNLLINARHAIVPKGGGTISVRGYKENESVIIAISDDGIGIEPCNLPRIFDPFYTNKSANSPSGRPSIRGSGLGLAVCISILKQHGGTIDVTSESGTGSTFTIRLPFHLAERRSCLIASELSASKSEQFSPSVLVVDDEMSVREVLYRALMPIASAVYLASNAADCESLLSANSFDVIILDYILPEMNADRLLPLIRKTNPFAKIIFISGWNGSPVKKNILKEQVNGWIDKPFNVETVLDTIQNLSHVSPKT
jgi:signal transduction histidine kinase/CheY-like chemotaxis protein